VTQKNNQWRLVKRPEGKVKTSDFEWVEESVPSLNEGQFLGRNLYLSLDPANRGWMNKKGSYREAIKLGSVMHGITISVVEETNHPDFAKGKYVQTFFGWQEYGISDGRGVNKIPKLPGVPLTAYLGVLGMIGLTAYFGLLEIGEPQPGETLVVSAAAGAVGSLVGQIGKIIGCRVVGIAGTDEKCRWITEELGFDAAINYKTENVRKMLKTKCPDGIDVYFDNVGGEILDAVLSQINQNARISVCGLISMYNATRPVPGPYNYPNILTRRARVQGFIVTDFEARYMEGLQKLGEWLLSGQLKYRVDVVDGLENAPVALNKLFDGSNKGKLIIKVSDE